MVKTNAAIYIRKSSDDGTSSSDDQLHDLTALAKRHQLNVVEIYREADGISASHLSTQARPEFERMKADFGTKFRTLIYWKIDRYSRKGATEAAELCELVKDTPNSRIIQQQDNGSDAAVLARFDALETQIANISPIDTSEIEEDVMDVEELIEELELRLDEDFTYQLGNLWWRTDMLMDAIRSQPWGSDFFQQHFGPQPGW